MANKIQKSVNEIRENNAPGATIKNLIVSMQSGIKAALPSVMTPERFTRIALSAVSNSPKLASCEPMSFIAAMMTAAQLGLEPNTPLGQAYLIPRRNNKKGIMECQFQIGYKGLLDLAWRSGEVADIQAETVYENDVWEYELGLNPKLRHIPADGKRGDPVRYYAVVRTKNGGTISAVMSVEDVTEFARKKSQTFDKGPWQTDFNEMAKKTVLKKALKYSPLSSDFVKGVEQDDSIHAEFGKDMTDIPCVDLDVDEDTGEVIDAPVSTDVPQEGQATMEGM